MPAYLFIEDFTKEVQIPKDGILSRTIHSDDYAKVLLFGFAAGQELSQHTAAVPAMLQIIQGEARISFDGTIHEMAPGSFAYMEAKLPHSVYAKTDLVMLLTMLTGAQPK